MRSKPFAAGIAGAHSHSGLALYDLEITVPHMNWTPVRKLFVFTPGFTTSAPVAGELWDGSNRLTSRIWGKDN
jgi:hypothetical protein